MGIAKVSTAFHNAGWKVVQRAADNRIVATLGDISYVYSMEADGVLYYARMYGEELDLVGNGVQELLEALADE